MVGEIAGSQLDGFLDTVAIALIVKGRYDVTERSRRRYGRLSR